jgi:ABC-2 type transport system permease protein
MIAAPPVTPRSFADRLRWVAIDSWTITRRDLIHWIAQPTQIIAALAYPISFVLLFGYVFGSAMTVEGGGDYREFLMPGLFAQTMAFGIGASMAAVTADVAKGVTDRFRSMPMSQSAVVIGRSSADLLGSLTDLGSLIACALVVGWSWHNGLGNALQAVGLLLLLRFAFLWIGIYLGLVAPTQEALTALWTALFPFTMITSAFASPEQMPAWLGTIAEWNPLSATITATRELFGNPGVNASGSWIAENAMLMSVVWPVVIVAVFLPLSVWRYRRLSR